LAALRVELRPKPLPTQGAALGQLASEDTATSKAASSGHMLPLCMAKGWERWLNWLLRPTVQRVWGILASVAAASAKVTAATAEGTLLGVTGTLLSSL